MRGGVGGTGGGRVAPARDAVSRRRRKAATGVFVVGVGIASAFGAHSALTDWNAKPCKSMVAAPPSAPLVFNDPTDWKNVPSDSASAVEWNDAANWSPGGVPTANDRVCLNFAGADRAITVSGAAVRVGSLDIAPGVTLDLRSNGYLSSARTIVVHRRATVLLAPGATLAADDRVRVLASGRVAASAPPSQPNDASSAKPRRARASDLQLATITANVTHEGYLATKTGAGLRIEGSVTLAGGSTIDNGGELLIVPGAITTPTVLATGGTTQGNEIEIESGTLVLSDPAEVHVRLRGNSTVGGTLPGKSGLTIAEGTSIRFVERLRSADGSTVHLASPGGPITNHGTIAFEACGPIAVSETGAKDLTVNELVNHGVIDVFGPGARSSCPDSSVLFTNGASLHNRADGRLSLSGANARLHITGADTRFTATAAVDLADRELGHGALTIDGNATFVSDGGKGRRDGTPIAIGDAEIVFRDGNATGTPGAQIHTTGPVTVRGVLGDRAELTATDDITLSGDLTVNGALWLKAPGAQPVTLNLNNHAINRDAATADPTVDLLPPTSRTGIISFAGSNCVIESTTGLIGIPPATTFENDCNHLATDELAALDVNVLGRIVNGAGKDVVFAGPKMRLLARGGEIINNGTLRLHKDATFRSAGSSTQGNPIDLVGNTTLIFPTGTRGASHLRVSGDGTGTRANLEGVVPSGASIELNTDNGYESRLVPAAGSANRGRITMVCGPGAATAFIDAAAPFVNTGSIEVGIATQWPSSPLPSCVATTIDTSTKGRMAVRAGNALTIRSLTLSAKNSSTGGSLLVEHGVNEGPGANLTVTGTLALLKGSVTNNGSLTVDEGRLDLNAAEADLGNSPIVLRRGTLRSTGHGFANVRTVGTVRWEASPSALNAEERLIPAGSTLDVRGALAANGPIVNNGTVILGSTRPFDTATPTAPNGNVFTNHGEVLLRAGGARTIKVSSFVNTSEGDAAGFVRNDSDNATITGTLENGARGAKDATVLLSTGSRLRTGSMTNLGRVWVQIGDNGPGTIDVGPNSTAGGTLKVSMADNPSVGTSFTVIKGPLVGHNFDSYDLGEDSFKPETIKPDTAGDSSQSIRITYKGSAITRTSIRATPETPGLGDDVTLTAIVDGANGRVPEGTEITFTDGRTVLGTALAEIDGGSVTATLTVRQPKIGSHLYRADYPGTTGHLPSNNYLTVTVGTGPSNVVIEQGRVAPIGKPYELAATVSSDATGLVPTGLVTFVDETMKEPTTLGTSTLRNGRATLRWTPTTEDFGARAIRAVYDGDKNVDASRSKKRIIEVQRATTTNLATSSARIPFGEALTLTATIENVPPGTQVAFVDGSAIIGSAKIRKGQAGITITDAAAGKHTYKAVYPGEVGFAPSEATTDVTVSSIDGFVSLDAPSAVNIDDDIALQARIQPETATGTITFLDTTSSSERIIGTATLKNGLADYSWRPGLVGSRSISARYEGSPNIKAATSSTAYLTVQRSTEATLDVTPSSPSFGDIVTLTFDIAGSVPDGTLATFRFDDSTPTRTAPITRGRATVTLTDLVAGTHRVSADYPGAVGYLPTAADTSVRVAKRGTTLRLTAPSSIDAERGAELSVEVTPKQATGSVTFIDTKAVPDRVVGTADVANGVASLTWTPAAGEIGERTIVARYEGTDNDASSTSPVASVAVERSTTTNVSVYPTTPVVGEPFALIASIDGGVPPGSTVTFTEGDKPLGTAAVKAGKATLFGVQATGGRHSFHASYPGLSGFRASVGVGFIAIAPAPSSVTVTGPAQPVEFGQGARFTVVVNASGSVPANRVRLRRNGTPVGPPDGVLLDSTGSATLLVNDLAAGDAMITAEYLGDADHRPSTSPAVALTVQPATTTLSATVIGSPRLGQPIRIAVTVLAGSEAKPNGRVTVSDTSGTLGSASVKDGSATVTLPPRPSVGSFAATVAFDGDTNLNPATTLLTIGVAKAKSAVGLTVSAPKDATSQRSVTFQVSVRGESTTGPIPTGTVAFYDGDVRLATRPLTATGTSSLTVRLTIGPHPRLRADYLGDDSFVGQASANVWATVLDASNLLPGTTPQTHRTPPMADDPRPKSVIPLAVAPATKSRRT